MTKQLVMKAVLVLAVTIMPAACRKAPAAGSLHCSGSGGPAVVFVSGLGIRTAGDWRQVRRAMAARPTACVYERAEVRTAGEMAEQLEHLLRAKRAARPYVLVAHSFGAIPARLFAARHPDAVAGMVLVDPSHEDMSRITALLPAEEQKRLNVATQMSPEAIDLEASFAELREGRRTPGFPLVVIQAARDENQPNEIWTAERLRRRAAIIRDLNEKLAATSPRGRFMIAGNSGHFVQIDEPEVVVEAVQWVLAQSKSSQSGAAALLHDYVDAVNSGSPEQLRGFHDRTAQRPDDALERARFDAQFHADTAGLMVRTMEMSTDKAATAVVESKLTGQRFRIQVSLAGNGRVRDLLVRVLPSETIPAMTVGELDAFVEKLASLDAFSGAVLIARDREVVYRKAWGWADRKLRARNARETRFNLASMNKMLTAVAIAQLVERGRVAFDDPVKKWFADFASESATVHHLLTHTSGLGSFSFEDARSARTTEDYLRLVDATPAFPPGERFQYSNSGYIILGRIIELASGQTYGQYVENNILRVAGMTATDCDPAPDRVAQGYMAGSAALGERVPNSSLLPGAGSSAGGCYSTVDDLHRFAVALRDGRLITKAMTQKLWTPFVRRDSTTNYGYGFEVRDDSVGHGGGFPGVSTFFRMNQRGVVSIVLSNYNNPAAAAVAERAGNVSIE